MNIQVQVLILGSLIALLVIGAVAAIVSNMKRKRDEDEKLRVQRENELLTNRRPDSPAVFSGLRPSGSPPQSRRTVNTGNGSSSTSAGSVTVATTPAVVIAGADTSGHCAPSDSSSCGGGE